MKQMLVLEFCGPGRIQVLMYYLLSIKRNLGMGEARVPCVRIRQYIWILNFV